MNIFQSVLSVIDRYPATPALILLGVRLLLLFKLLPEEGTGAILATTLAVAVLALAAAGEDATMVEFVASRVGIAAGISVLDMTSEAEDWLDAAAAALDAGSADPLVSAGSVTCVSLICCTGIWLVAACVSATELTSVLVRSIVLDETATAVLLPAVDGISGFDWSGALDSTGL